MRKDKEQQILKTVALSFCGLCLILFIGFGIWGHPGTDPFSQENIYEALHPFKFLDIIGCTLFLGFTVFVSGVWSKFFGEASIPAGSTWPNYVAFAAGVLGVILLFV